MRKKNLRFGQHKGSQREMAKYCTNRCRNATTETMKEYWLHMWRILVYVCGAWG